MKRQELPPLQSAQQVIEELKNEERCSLMLASIRNNPEKAFKLSNVENGDIIGEVLNLLEMKENSPDRRECLFTALLFNDVRTEEIAKKEFITTFDQSSLVMAAKRLSFMSDAEKAKFIVPILFADSNVNRTRVAANLLAGNPLLSPKAAIRVCSISDRKNKIPEINTETAHIWIEEMQGPYPEGARKSFLKKPKFMAVLHFWDKMEKSLKLFFIRQCAKSDIGRYNFLFLNVLKYEKDEEIVCAALGYSVKLSNDNIKEAVRQLFNSKSERIRSEAICAFSDKYDWSKLIENETSTDVQCTLIKKMGELSDERYLPVFKRMITDTNWQVRSACAEAFAKLGERSTDTLKELFFNENENVRAAAAKVLFELNETDWLEENVKS